MAKDIDDDYFYETGTVNENLENFQVYEKNGELHFHDTRTDDVTKVKENGELSPKLVNTERIGNGQFPDVVAFRDDADVVVVGTTDGSEIARADATTDAYSALQAGLDTMGADSHMLIRAGRYSTDTVEYVTPLLFVQHDNVKISGDGDATHLTIEDGSTETDKGVKVVHVGSEDHPENQGTAAYDGFTLESLKIDGNYQNQGNITNQYDGHNIEVQGSDAKIHNVTSINATGDGYEAMSRTTDANGDAQSKFHTVTGCIFRDNFEQGVHAHGVFELTVGDCVIDGEINNDTVNTYTHQAPNQYVKFDNCVIANSSMNGAGLNEGANGWKSYDVTFSDCTFVNNTRSGVIIDHQYAERVRLRGNDYIDNGEMAVEMIGAPDVQIEGGSMERNGLSAIFVNAVSGSTIDLEVKHPTIRDNNQDANGGDAIHVEGRGGSVDFLRVTEPTIRGSSHDLGYYIHEYNSDTSWGTVQLRGGIIQDASTLIGGSATGQLDVQDVDGIQYENRGVAESVIPIDATGIQTQTINPGLDKSLQDASDVQVTLANPDQTDIEIGGVWTTNVSGAAFDAKVNVVSASGTSNAFADIAWEASVQ
jgi:hypothetical protein